MHILAALAALIVIVSILWDAFETIILPRRVRRKLRLTRAFYDVTWAPWRAVARRLRNEGRRESFLSLFGPLALILLLVTWAVGLVVGFALLQWSFGSPLRGFEQHFGFGSDLYFSGVTFFTLGFGDLVPYTGAGRLIAVVEAGLGFGFLALIISYLPVLYQAFSRREVSVSLLDARAGSPPTAGELLRRHGEDCPRNTIPDFLLDWERWSAELMESHLSYPSLAYFRSQHDNQAWLSALTVVLDASALVLAGIDDIPTHQARLTFAMARHAAVDLCQVFGADFLPYKEHRKGQDRLPPETLARLRGMLRTVDMEPHETKEADMKLRHLRQMYEPYVLALADLLAISLPPWLPRPGAEDDWLSSPTE